MLKQSQFMIASVHSSLSSRFHLGQICLLISKLSVKSNQDRSNAIYKQLYTFHLSYQGRLANMKYRCQNMCLLSVSYVLSTLSTCFRLTLAINETLVVVVVLWKIGHVHKFRLIIVRCSEEVIERHYLCIYRV